MDEKYHIFWGDTHHNTYQHYVQDPPMPEILDWSSAYLDFYTGAYYTPAYVTAPVVENLRGQVTGPQGGHLSEKLSASTQWAGVHLEGLKDLEPMAREWREFQDVYYQLAHKAKLHRAVPEPAYTAALEWVDEDPPPGEANYRVRVEQRNGQRAWSSPIWIKSLSGLT